MANRLQELWAKLKGELLYQPSQEDVADAVEAFLKGEPGWTKHVIDIDPALSSKGGDEALSELMTYQGLHAIALHRKANALYNSGDFFGARRLSQGARRVTGGIEIHPGAKIGKGFFIDHGAGVVIGETTEIGDNVFLYHGVTLGAAPPQAEGNRRHPKLGNNITIGNGVQVLGPVVIEDGVEIGAGAKIIGKIRIGAGAVISPGVEVRQDIPAGARVVGMLPELPGILDRDTGAQTPIFRQNGNGKAAGTMVHNAAWQGHLSKALQRLGCISAPTI